MIRLLLAAFLLIAPAVGARGTNVPIAPLPVAPSVPVPASVAVSSPTSVSMSPTSVATPVPMSVPMSAPVSLPMSVAMPGAAGSTAFATAVFPMQPGAPGPSRTNRPKRIKRIPKPILSGSTTGYVENAVIASQIRLRFDAANGNGVPDLAEFFYAKCGCYRLLGADPNAPGPAPTLPHDGDPFAVPIVETNVDFKEYRLYAEYAPVPRFSIFADLPVRSISPEVNASASGVGDVNGGIRLGLAASEAISLTLQSRVYFPTGDARKGLGTDHHSVEFSMLLHRAVGDRVSFGAEGGAWIPLEGSSAMGISQTGHFYGNIIRWGVGAGVDVVRRPAVQFAPVLEFVGWNVRGGYYTHSEDGTVATTEPFRAKGVSIVNVKFGGRLTWLGRNSLYLGLGAPLTDDSWYDQIIRGEYRVAL